MGELEYDTGYKPYNDLHLMFDSELYDSVYTDLPPTAIKVLHGLLKLIDRDLNTVQIGGNTLTSLEEFTGFTEGTIRKQMVILNKFGVAEKTNLRGEYIVNPMFAVKGSATYVWRNYHRIEEARRSEMEVR